ncbi:DMT family transporter [Paenibacillus thalictri]|uniref:DMT family transporter n=1 Tax=Paenibacillus thalictri TaxID=2527873 RepID=A0A4V2J4J1_9BACL|nr:DMT family transporter [Paenibacillus thalictri]
MKTYALLLTCVLFWGSNFVFGTILVQQFSPMALSAVRLSFTALFFIVVMLFTRRWPTLKMRDLLLFLPLGLIGTVVNQTAFFNGMQTTDATTAALVMSLAPITTAYLARWLLKEPLSKPMITGSVAALAGVFLVVGRGGGFSLSLSLGEIMIFIAMLSFAVSVILVRKLTERMEPLAITIHASWIGAVLQVPCALLLEPSIRLSHSVWMWLLAVGSALGSQVIATLIWNRQLKEIGAGKSAVFLNLQPFVAMLVGFILLGTKVTLGQLGGSLLIIGGVLIASEVLVKKEPPLPVPKRGSDLNA